MIRKLIGFGFTFGHKKSGSDGESLPLVGFSYTGLIYFFGLAELDLWWQWHGLGDDDRSVFRERLSQISLDGGGR